MPTRLTVYMAVIVLALAAAVQALAATQSLDNSKKISNVMGSMSCSIAFVHYLLIMGSDGDEMYIRYSDWIWTLPLLLFDIMLIFGIDIAENILLCLLTLLFLLGMLVAGWMAINAPRHSNMWLTVGFACLLAVYGIVLLILPHNLEGNLTSVTLFFFLLWSLYGVVAITDRNGVVNNNQYAQHAYDVLDICTKAVFGLAVATNILV
jgi:bacteriorhodopsin